MESSDRLHPDVETRASTSQEGMEIEESCSTAPVDSDASLQSMLSLDRPISDDSNIELGNGKFCAFCNCGERSLLGQGDLTRCDPTPGFNPFKKMLNKSRRNSSENDPNASMERSPKHVTMRRTRGGFRPHRDRSKSPRRPNPHSIQDDEGRPVMVVDELSNVGFADDVDVNILFEPTGHTYAHHCCAAWSEGVCQTEDYILINVDKAVFAGMSLKCSYCKRVGATILCRIPKCNKIYHYPCAASAGTFQAYLTNPINNNTNIVHDIKTMSLLCPDHLDQAEEIAGPESNCVVCDCPGEISEQLFCTSCGQHYHGNCLDPPVEVNPIVRAGWQCPECKICQTCRQPGDDNKMLVCDTCDKGYHTFCLKPVMTTIPKNGWKCKNCRICGDCGSRTPGSGPSSRWHLNYSVCDSCYQQRNKGCYCPLCGKAYRHFSQKAMLQCNFCKKHIHAECDSEADLPTIQQQREVDCIPVYICPICKNRDPSEMEISSTASEQAQGTTDLLLGGTEEHGAPNTRTSEIVYPLSATTSTSTTPLSSLSMASLGIVGQPPVAALPNPAILGKPALSCLSSASLLSNRVETPTSLLMCLPGDDSLLSLNEDSVNSMDIDMSILEKGVQQLNQITGTPHLSALLGTAGIGLGKPSVPMLGKMVGKKRMGVGRPRKTGKFCGQNMIHEVPRFPRKGPHSYLHGTRMPGKRRAKTGISLVGRRGPRGRMKASHGIHSSSQLFEKWRSCLSLNARGRKMFQALGRGKLLKAGSSLLDQFQIKDEESPMHSTVVLCSSKDNFVLGQDMCVSCGSYGRGDESRLIGCSQCGQCYHPYCVNIKVTRVVLTKGWRCLDCTVCEGCGQPHDEGRLLLCDDCDISYHTYCLDPPLDQVPQGNWKCKWCVYCMRCGATSPGYSCIWQCNYTLCGPCASLSTCPICMHEYTEDDLILQCTQCDRWLHTICDGMKTEADVERAVDLGYHCCICRPKTASPPHLAPTSSFVKETDNVHPTSPLPKSQQKETGWLTSLNALSGWLTKEPTKPKPQSQFIMDGVCLSENGMHQIKSLSIDFPMRKKQVRRRRSSPLKNLQGTLGNALTTLVPAIEDKPDLLMKQELPVEEEKESNYDLPLEAEKPDVVGEDEGSLTSVGTAFHKPEESGLEKKRRQRKPYRIGVGGFMARPRGRGSLLSRFKSITAFDQSLDRSDGLGDDLTGDHLGNIFGSLDSEKPRRRRRGKRKSHLEDSYPEYLQKAFFGENLLVNRQHKEFELDLPFDLEKDTFIDERLATAHSTESMNIDNTNLSNGKQTSKETDNSAEDLQDLGDSEALKDILPQDLPQDEELLGMLMSDGDDLSKHSEGLDDIGSVDAEQTQENQEPDAVDHKEDTITANLDSILSSNFNLDNMVTEGVGGLPQMDSKDVEDLFKGVLNPQEEGTVSTQNSVSEGNFQILPELGQSLGVSTLSRSQPPTSLPMSPAFNVPASPYPQEYNSPQFSPGFSEPPSPWPLQPQDGMENDGLSYNQRNILKWESDEALGTLATISPVLYANLNHPELKAEYPEWTDRAKQIAKIWRKVAQEKKAPFLREWSADVCLRLHTVEPKLRDSMQPLPPPAPTPIPPVQPTPPLIQPEMDQLNSAMPSPQSLPVIPGIPSQPGMLVSQGMKLQDQEKLRNQKTIRAQEQERQWKQMQQLRQQLLMEQRAQSMSVSASSIDQSAVRLSEPQQPSLQDSSLLTDRTAAPQQQQQQQDEALKSPWQHSFGSPKSNNQGLPVSLSQDIGGFRGGQSGAPTHELSVSTSQPTTPVSQNSPFSPSSCSQPSTPRPHQSPTALIDPFNQPPSSRTLESCGRMSVPSRDIFSRPQNVGHQPSDSFSPRPLLDPYSQAAATPRPNQEPFSPPTTKDALDTYIRAPNTPRPDSFVRMIVQRQQSDSYISQSASESFNQPGNSTLVTREQISPAVVSRQLSIDPYAQAPATPRPSAETFIIRPGLSPHQSPETFPQPMARPPPPPPPPDPFLQSRQSVNSEPYAHQPNTPRPLLQRQSSLDPYVLQPNIQRPTVERFPIQSGHTAPFSSDDPYAKSVGTPRPPSSLPHQFTPPQTLVRSIHANFHQPMSMPRPSIQQESYDPYARQPATPRPQQSESFSTPVAPVRRLLPQDPYSQPPGTPRPPDSYTHRGRLPPSQDIEEDKLPPQVIRKHFLLERNAAMDPNVMNVEKSPMAARQQLRDLLVKQSQEKEKRKQLEQQERLIREQQGQMPLRHWPDKAGPQQPPQQFSVSESPHRPFHPPPPPPPPPPPISQAAMFPPPRPQWRPQDVNRMPFSRDSKQVILGPPLESAFRQPLPLPDMRPSLPPGHWRFQGSPQQSSQIAVIPGRGQPFSGSPFQPPGDSGAFRHPGQYIELKHQRPRLPGPYPGHANPVRVPGPSNPLDPYDHLVQQQMQQQQLQQQLQIQQQLQLQQQIQQQQQFHQGLETLQQIRMDQQQQQMQNVTSNVAFPSGKTTPLQHPSLCNSENQQQNQQQQPQDQQRPPSTLHPQNSDPSDSLDDTAAVMTESNEGLTDNDANLSDSDAALGHASLMADVAETLSQPEAEDSVADETEKSSQDEALDDELLELGNDFNLLEYADPELDKALTDGEKSVFDDLKDDLKDPDSPPPDESEPTEGTLDDLQKSDTKSDISESASETSNKEKRADFKTAGGSSTTDFQSKFIEYSQKLEKAKAEGMVDRLDDMDDSKLESLEGSEDQTNDSMCKTSGEFDKKDDVEPASEDNQSSQLKISTTPTSQSDTTFSSPTVTTSMPSPVASAALMESHVINSSALPQNIPSLSNSGIPVQQRMGQSPGFGQTSPLADQRNSLIGLPPVGGKPKERVLLLEEQPLLLEDLLEQEKQELHKQQQSIISSDDNLLGEIDLEKLQAEVLAENVKKQESPFGSPGIGSPALPIGIRSPVSSIYNIPPQSAGPRMPTISPRLQHMDPLPSGEPLSHPPVPPPQPPCSPQIVRPPLGFPKNPQGPSPFSGLGVIPSNLPTPSPRENIIPGLLQGHPAQLHQIATANLHPSNINIPEGLTEAEHQQELHQEQWLLQQQNVIQIQQKLLETEIGKHRKSKKALAARQRQLRKSGQELSPSDTIELQKVSQEVSNIQKQLEQIRKHSRQHAATLQDFRVKQQDRHQQIQHQHQALLSHAVIAGPPPPRTLMPTHPQGPIIRQPQPLMSPHGEVFRQPFPPCVQVTQDDNNPFSESFQQREQLERMRQQNKHPLEGQRIFPQQEPCVLMQEHKDDPQNEFAHLPFFKEDTLPFGQPQTAPPPPSPQPPAPPTQYPQQLTSHEPGLQQLQHFSPDEQQQRFMGQPRVPLHMISRFSQEAAQRLQRAFLSDNSQRFPGPRGFPGQLRFPIENPRLNMPPPPPYSQHMQAARLAKPIIIMAKGSPGSLPQNSEVSPPSVFNSSNSGVPCGGKQFSQPHTPDRVCSTPSPHPSPLRPASLPPSSPQSQMSPLHQSSLSSCSKDSANTAMSGKDEHSLIGQSSSFLVDSNGNRICSNSSGAISGSPMSQHSSKPSTPIAANPLTPGSPDVKGEQKLGSPVYSLMNVKQEIMDHEHIDMKMNSDVKAVDAESKSKNTSPSASQASTPSNSSREEKTPMKLEFIDSGQKHENSFAFENFKKFQEGRVCLMRQSSDPSDGDARSNQNILLKQLLQNNPQSVNYRKPSEEFDQDEDIQLTPEQQRQLEILDNMPLITETSEKNDCQLTEEMKRAEYERRRREMEVAPKVKRKQNVKRQMKQKDKAENSAALKKRNRKKPNEDYESFDTNLMKALQKLEPLHVGEPIVSPDYNIVPAHGSGIFTGESKLTGIFGHADLNNCHDFYSTYPFGPNHPPTPPTSLPSTPPGTFRPNAMQESSRCLGVVTPDSQPRYQLSRLSESSDDLPSPGIASQQQRLLMQMSNSAVDMPLSLPTPPLHPDQQRTPSRASSTPDTIVSSSSPECLQLETPEKFPGLQLIEPDGDDSNNRASPVIPILAPVAIKAIETVGGWPTAVLDRLAKAVASKPKMDILRLPEKQELKSLVKNFEADLEIKDKENVLLLSGEIKSEKDLIKSKLSNLSKPLKDSNSNGTVAVTLMLSATAAEDINGVIAAVADLLRIAVPPSYEIIERSSTPQSQRLELYKKHKELGLNVESLLSNKARFCRHCDVVVLSAGIRKKASEMPYLKDDQQDEDEVIFCSTNCYMQFAITHQSTSVTENKEAGAVVDHTSDESEALLKTESKNESSPLSTTSQPSPLTSPPSSPFISSLDTVTTTSDTIITTTPAGTTCTSTTDSLMTSHSIPAIAATSGDISPSTIVVTTQSLISVTECISSSSPVTTELVSSPPSALLITSSLSSLPLSASIPTTTSASAPISTVSTDNWTSVAYSASMAVSASISVTTPISSTTAILSPLSNPIVTMATTTAGMTVSQTQVQVSPTSHTQSLVMIQPSQTQMQEIKSPEIKSDTGQRKSSCCEEPTCKPVVKKWKGVKWKYWTIEHVSLIPPPDPHNGKDIGALMERLQICIKPEIMPDDSRRCLLCLDVGDGVTDGPARLLNMDVDKWVHLNCALWSAEVYETVNGALMNVDQACRRGLTLECCSCHKVGATLGCYRIRCTNIYHFPCAMRERCMFFKDKTILCPLHSPKFSENELTCLSVFRRVYINRDENKQVASIMHLGDRRHTMRIGSMIFHTVGQLLPHQLQAFHTQNCIYPVGFKITRLYWSMRYLTKRCHYVCSIQENEGKPEFTVLIQEKGHNDFLLKDSSAKGVWHQVLTLIEKMRKTADVLKLFPIYLTGEDLFGLTDPFILRVIESLPGIETLTSYNFKFGRSPLIELPLAINPTGCARTEPKLRTHFKRPHTLTSNTSSRTLQNSLTGVEVLSSPYMKQFVHSKSSQYRRLKSEWRTNVYLARSRIQGLGLYATRDIEKHTMVIEYIGDLIRNEVANRRETIYEEQNRGVYMFRIDSETVIDATLAGGPARYINHSCNPNCVAEVVNIDKEHKIIIISNRRIARGEELTYDYKFDFEDDQHKIACLCGAPNCRKWMN